MVAETIRGEMLPKTGAVCVQWKRCGKASCRCRSGDPHGPYFALFWRENGRLRKRYVRLAAAPALIQSIRDRKAERRRALADVGTARRQWRVRLAALREIERGN
jgi:hypothetical protein